MPIYEYQCQNCGHILEELQSMKEEPLVTCPNCGKDELKKLIGGGAGLIFKGSGFYLTDYKKKGSSSSSSSTSAQMESLSGLESSSSKGSKETSSKDNTSKSSSTKESSSKDSSSSDSSSKESKSKDSASKSKTKTDRKK